MASLGALVKVVARACSESALIKRFVDSQRLDARACGDGQALRSPVCRESGHYFDMITVSAFVFDLYAQEKRAVIQDLRDISEVNLARCAVLMHFLHLICQDSTRK